MNARFLAAMAVYSILSVAAWLTLDGSMRTAIWILMGGLAVKTVIAWRARW